MEKKPSWDDIPSLNLELDNGSDGEATRDKRANPRLSTNDVREMFMVNNGPLYVHVATAEGTLKKKGLLQDINHTGMCFIMPAHPLEKGQIIRVGTVLKKFVFKTKAEVRWKTNDQVGIKFIDPKPEDVTFLAELYSAKILNRIK